MADPTETVLTIDMGDAPAVEAAASASDVVVIDENADEGAKLPKTAVLQPNGSVLLTLRFPVTLKWRNASTGKESEDTTATLLLNRLNGADMRVLMNAGSGNTVSVGLARSARMKIGLFNAIFDRMDGSDAKAAGDVLDYFLGSGAPMPSGPPASR